MSCLTPRSNFEQRLRVFVVAPLGVFDFSVFYFRHVFQFFVFSSNEKWGYELVFHRPKLSLTLTLAKVNKQVSHGSGIEKMEDT